MEISDTRSFHQIETTGSTTFIERGLHGDDELVDGDVKAIELKADAIAKN